MKLIKLIN